MLANSEQPLLYWDIGHDILEKQNTEGWGAKVAERMSADLKAAFPDMKGWSLRNLKYKKAFAEAWTRNAIVKAPLAQLSWYHHLALLGEIIYFSCQECTALKTVYKAMEFLMRTDLTIAEVAASVGFGDSLYFSRQFSRVTGCSPRKYRDSEHGHREVIHGEQVADCW